MDIESFPILKPMRSVQTTRMPGSRALHEQQHEEIHVENTRNAPRGSSVAGAISVVCVENLPNFLRYLQSMSRGGGLRHRL